MNHEKIAMLAGSFDPITLGHESIALRSAAMFDKLYIGIGENIHKRCFFTIDERIEMLHRVFEDVEGIEIVVYQGLTVDFCRKKNISYLVRGLRSAADFDMESSIAHANWILRPDIETVFLLSEPQYAGISSTAVREIILHGGKVDGFVPEVIMDILNKKIHE